MSIPTLVLVSTEREREGGWLGSTMVGTRRGQRECRVLVVVHTLVEGKGGGCSKVS
jgi:hypothetical protein